MPRRQALGLILAFLLVLAGRAVRNRMLLGPDGAWRDDLWLDELVVPAAAAAADTPARPVLAGPLPVNTCSLDSLTLLPGVGPVLAARIDEARRAGLRFRCAADLRRVKGIGPALSGRLDSLVLYFPDPDSAGPEPDRQAGGPDADNRGKVP